MLTHALASRLDVEVAVTTCRGHAQELAERAASDGTDVVVALGGDGTLNEIVNGLMVHGPAATLPRVAVVPGGSTNVFARDLGLPNDPVEATGALLDALRGGTERRVSLGRVSSPGAESRWFTFCAGLGFDAGVVGRVEQHRANGKRSTHTLYARQVARQFVTESRGGFGQAARHGGITLERPGAAPVSGLTLGIVSNTSPWTYFGNHPVVASPQASFDSGLDLFALTRLTPASTTRYATQLLVPPGRGPHGRHVVAVHDAEELTLRAESLLPLQVDGDHLGDRKTATFQAVPRALRVIV